jgi:hypothetical protein
MTVKSIRFREGDKFIETTTTVTDAVIDFQDILDACEIKDDDMCEAPWENCDGFEHTATPVRNLDDAKHASEMQGHVWSEGYRAYVVIELKSGEDWGTYEYLRAQGASKQVAREASAATRRKAIEQLKEWYQHGWSYYGVTCEYEGAEASVWGVDDYEYADTDVRHEIAREVAHELEKQGYTIINYPPADTAKKLTARRLTTAVSLERGVHQDIYARSMTADAWKAEFARNLNSQNWAD